MAFELCGVGVVLVYRVGASNCGVRGYGFGVVCIFWFVVLGCLVCWVRGEGCLNYGSRWGLCFMDEGLVLGVCFIRFDLW